MLYDGETAAMIEAALSGLDAKTRAAAVKQLTNIEQSGPGGKELVTFFLVHGGIDGAGWTITFKEKGKRLAWGDGKDRSKWKYVSAANSTGVTLDIEATAYKAMKVATSKPAAASGFIT
jgi:hypothetical protein